MKEYEKARQYFQIALNSAAQSSDDYGVNQTGYYEIRTAIKALEKQIPKKPVIKYSKKPITHKYGRLMNFFCPTCGRFLTAMYETDVENGGGIHRNWKGCPTCLQAVDFDGYYHLGKLEDEINWSDHPTEKGGNNGERTSNKIS